MKEHVSPPSPQPLTALIFSEKDRASWSPCSVKKCWLDQSCSASVQVILATKSSRVQQPSHAWDAVSTTLCPLQFLVSFLTPSSTVSLELLRRCYNQFQGQLLSVILSYFKLLWQNTMTEAIYRRICLLTAKSQTIACIWIHHTLFIRVGERDSSYLFHFSRAHWLIQCPHRTLPLTFPNISLTGPPTNIMTSFFTF